MTEQRASYERAARGGLTGRAVLGAILVLAGAVWLADTAGVAIRWQPTLAGVLIVVGVGVLVLAPRGLHGGLTAAGVVLTVVVTVLALTPIPLAGGLGEARVTPVSTAELEEEYAHGAGELTIDLRSAQLPPGTTRLELEASAGLGRVVVRR